MDDKNPNDSAPVANSDDEIDLLDLLLPLAKNWKLVLIGPLAASIIAFVAASALPKTYESTAVVAVPNVGNVEGASALLDIHQLSAIIDSHQVVAATARALEKPEDAASLEKIRANLRVERDRGNTFVRIVASGSNPDQALRLGQVVLAQLQTYSRPPQSAAQRFELELASEQRSLEQGLALEQALAQRMLERSGEVSENVARSYNELVRGSAERRGRIAVLQARLAGVAESHVLAPPQLPLQAVSPRPLMVAALAGLAAGFALVFLVLVRHAWRNAASNPASSEKVRAIRNALRWRQR